MTELNELDAIDQAQLVRDGETSPLELVDDAIARIEKLNPELNAVIHELFDKARSAARDANLPDGPFRGVPIALKDLDGHSAGDPFHCGNKLLKEIGYTPQDESFSHQKLRAAGFIFVGKTNCPEFGLIPTTEPEAYGPTRNPWDTDRSTGGSSGGSAAAVAARMVAVGTAGDGGGSIRIPASECGIVGLKPSRGRVSLGPDLGSVWEGLVVRGCVSRSVRDTAAVLDVMSGEMPGDPYIAPPPVRPFAAEVGADPGRLRIGFASAAPAGMATTTADCEAAVRAAADLVAELGHSIEDAAPQAMDDPAILQHAVTVISTWAKWELEDWGRRIGRTFGPDDVERGTWDFAELAKDVKASDYVASAEELRRKSRAAARWWEEFDILITPTLPEPPPPLGMWEPTEDNPFRGLEMSTKMVAFVAPFNITGQPAISLPLHWNDQGLPIGVQFVAAYGREDLLIRLGSQLEEARPWVDRRPTVS